MRISKKVQYGIIAMVEIGIYSQNGDYVPIFYISKMNKLPFKFLENIMISLKANNLVFGKRGGNNGGYRLNKNPNDITLTEIINALDNTILDENQNNININTNIELIVNEMIWNKVNKSMLDFTNSITLSMMIEYFKIRMNKDAFLHSINSNVL